MASPECRDPFTLVAHERAKDELVEELCEAVNRDLERAGFRGRASVGKNSVDSQGNTLGSHESYWVEDRIAPLRLALFVPVWLALWAVSLPVVAWLFALRIGLLAFVLGEELSRHAQVQQQPPPVVKTREQVLADPLQSVDARARQLAREPRGRREEEVARARGVHLRDATADQRGRELPARDLDLGKLGHRHSFLCGAASR